METGDFTTGFISGFTANSTVSSEVLVGNGGYAKGPVRSLMSALLFDGVQACLHYVMHDSKAERDKSQEAYQWVMRKGNEYIFSFDNVCEALGLDPEYVRLGVINSCSAYQGEWKRARRNF